MDTFESAVQVLLPLAYLLAAIAYGRIFFSGAESGAALATMTFRAAFILHLVYLVAIGSRWHQLPAATAAQGLSIVAVAVAAVYLLLEWQSGVKGTGFWFASLVFILALLGSLLRRPEPPPQSELFAEPLFAAHVSLALVGFAAFAVAAGYGFLFLMLYRELKQSRFSTFFGKLPPLEALDRMMVGALVVGLAALTSAVAAGVLRAQGPSVVNWLSDPTVIATLAIWGLYAAALGLRRLRHWQGRQTALASLAGFAGIVVSLVVVSFFFRGFHGFGP